MCIRDSDTDVQMYAMPVTLLILASIFIMMSVVQQPHTPLCLLYTSDAADERSSVDLGGRRIIKKKKAVEILQVRRLIENPMHNLKTHKYLNEQEQRRKRSREPI